MKPSTELGAGSGNVYAYHACFHIHQGRYPDFENEWFRPNVSLFTSILSYPDISQAHLY